MSKVYNIKIEYIKATDKVKQVCLQLTPVGEGENAQQRKCVYVLNQDKNDNSFSINSKSQANKSAFKLKSFPQESFIRNMYSTKDMFFKSAIYSKGISERTGSTFDFQNIFAHTLSQPYKDVIQVENTLYAIADLSPNGRISVDEDSYEFLSKNNNTITLYDNIIQTCLYDRDAIQQVVDDINEYPDDVERLEKDKRKIIEKIFTGVQYNTMLEIPGSIQNDFDSGNLAANSFKGKNQYNSIYNMEHTVDSDDVANLSNDLKHARNYIKIDNCNTQLYFKYYDNMTYISASEEKIINAGEEIEIKQQELSVDNNQTEQLYSDYQKYQNIEMIDCISRYANQYGHKSNLYSIDIKTNIFDDDINPKLTDNDKIYLKNNIKSYVKNITKQLMPAHTQLFQVTIN